jgi:hypothetical protein
MPDVISTAPARVRTSVAIDQHKLSLVAGISLANGGTPEPVRLENTERAIRRFVEFGGPESLVVCYAAGPGGYDLRRLPSRREDTPAPRPGRGAGVRGATLARAGGSA